MAQNRPNRFTEAVSIDSAAVRRGSDRVHAALPDSGVGRRSHAVRNGAITGAVLGLGIGYYAGTRAGQMTGCKTYAVVNGPTECHEQRTKNVLLLSGTAVGAVLFSLTGAGIGKLWNVLGAQD